MKDDGQVTTSRTPDVEMVETDRLSPHPRNPRRGDVPLIRSLIRKHGFYGVIVAQRSTGRILVGRHRYQAAVEEGMEHVPVEWRDVDDAKALEMVLSDNRASDVASYDDEELKALLKEADDLIATGWDEKAVAELLGPQAKPQAPREVPSLPSDPVTQLGDLWVLGDHRLLCGDATSELDLQRVLDVDREIAELPVVADLMLTDPPYGIGVDYGGQEDSQEALVELTEAFSPLIRKSANVGLVTPGNANQRMYPAPSWTLAWVEQAGIGSTPWGFSCWQPVLAYGADPYLARGLGRRPDIYVGQGEGASSEAHPVAKPLGVWRWLMERGSTSEGDTVLDPFAGAGTTLVVAEELGRRARCVEISPGFCDVIIERWESFTGGKAVRA